MGLGQKQVSLGLDWCHAVHHISLALEPLLEDGERKRVYKKLRKWLKRGSWREVVDELLPSWLGTARLWDRIALGADLQSRLVREYERWQLVHRQVLELTRERRRRRAGRRRPGHTAGRRASA